MTIDMLLCWAAGMIVGAIITVVFVLPRSVVGIIKVTNIPPDKVEYDITWDDKNDFESAKYALIKVDHSQE